MTCQTRAWPVTWDLGVDAEGAPLTLARRGGEDGVAVYAIFRGADQHGPGAAELYGLTIEALAAIGGALSAC